MKMRKSKNKKILEAASEVAQEKERQKLLEEAELHFKSEWDALCFELEHPSPEFIAAGKRATKAIENIDFSKANIIDIKL